MPSSSIPAHLRVVGTSLVLALITGHSAQVWAEDLGEIQVESSTITEQQRNKRQEPSSVTTISGDEVDAAHTENIQQLLQSIPGVTTEIQSGDSLKIHIRGMDNQQFMGEDPGVVIVIDGVPVFERTGRVNIDLDNIESITVIRGSASYLFGNDAIGGAVIITTKRGAYREGQRYGLDYGSFGYYKVLGSIGYNTDAYNYYLQMSSRGATGYHDDSAYNANYINGKYQYYLNDSSDFTIGMELGQREKNSHGTVTGVTAAQTDPRSTDPAYNDYANHYDVNLGKFFITYNKDTSVTSNMTVSLYQFGDDTFFLSAPNSVDPSLYNLNNDYHQVQRGLKAEWRDKGQNRAWMTGIDLRANTYADYVTVRTGFTRGPKTYNVGDIYSNTNTDESVVAAYGEYKRRVNSNWTVIGNARIDAVTRGHENYLTAASYSKSYVEDSWRLGATRQLGPDRHLFTNISTGFRLPSVEEAFIGRNGSLGATAANINLTPEHTLNIEIGLRGNLRGGERPVEFEVALFNIRRMDYILATSGLYSGPGGGTSSFENIGDAMNNGLELSLKGKHSERLRWNVAYTYLDARFTRYDNFNLLLWNGSAYVETPMDLAGNVIPRTPQHHLNINLAYQISDKLVLNGEMDSTSGYYADELNMVPIAGRTVVNTMLSYEDKRDEKHSTTWFIRIDNLFDTNYYNTARGFYDSNKDGVFDAEDISITVNQGRTFTIGMAMQL